MKALEPGNSLIVFLGVLFLAACAEVPGPAATPTPDRMTLIPPIAEKLTAGLDPYPPILHVPGWQTPVSAPGLINTTGLEDSPFITPDGSQMLFFFTPTIENPPERQVLDGVTGLYLSEWDGSGWAAPRRVMLADPRSFALDGCGTLSGDELWFCSIREGNLREIDIWVAHMTGDRWGEVGNAGERLNLDLMVGELHLSANRELMLYHTSSLPGHGGMDIWLIRWEEGGWSEPENVTAVNTAGDEGWPFLSEDGQALWFTRFFQGSPAIFRSVWTGTEWGEPEMVISQFAGEPTLDRAGNLYFVHHVVLDGVIHDADIYVAKAVP